MKILYIVPYVPNLIRVRPYQLLRALVERGHAVTLATLWSDPAEQADLTALAALDIRIIAQQLPRWRPLLNSIRTAPTQAPFQAAYCWQPTMVTALRQLLESESFDAVHVEHLRGAQYGIYGQQLLRSLNRTTPVIWDSVDCISHLFAQAAKRSSSVKGRVLTWLDLARTRRYEGELVRRFDHVVVTSPTDRAALLQLAAQGASLHNQDSQVTVLPNGVDLDYFAPNGDRREPATLVFSGKMSYHANITAVTHLVHEIMPFVWARQPQAKLWITGKDPAPSVRALDTQASDGRVIVTGTVPDIRPYLRQSSLAVAPVPYGAGIQNKVLEAMSCGTAVVASAQSSSALQAKPQQDLMVAETPTAFAEAILTLLASPEQREQMGNAARRYVEQYHRWATIAAQLEAIYHTAGEVRRAPQSH